MRHAEAELMHSGDNLARRLTREGHSQAASAGRLLAARGFTADYAVVSPAQRTRSTFQELCAEWGTVPGHRFDERLYRMAHGQPPYDQPFDTVEAMEEVLAETPGDATCVLLLGHNPSIGETVSRLGHLLPAKLSSNYPTATATVLELPEGGMSLQPGLSVRAVVYGGRELIEPKGRPAQGRSLGPA